MLLCGRGTIQNDGPVSHRAFHRAQASWQVPGKSQMVQVKVKVLVAQLCLTHCNPMDCRPPGSSVHGILQAGILEWVAIPISREIFPTQGLNLDLLHCRWILHH